MRVSILILTALLGACTSYQPSGLTGGFTETKLNERQYEVRFQGNGFTKADRVQTFLLRRAAEITLEHGFRYFALGDSQNMDQNDFWRGTYSSRSVIVRFLDAQSEDKFAADAVTVISETDELAGGRLSEEARATRDRLAAPQ